MSDMPNGKAPDGADAARVEELLGKTIGDIGIPPCPQVLVQINAEMGRDDPNLKRLEAAISSDVALAAGLVALANSPFFGVRGRVRSVREALQMLGLGTAGQAIAGLILRKMFPPTPAMDRFWDSSARIARLSGWLVGPSEIGGAGLRSDEAYTFGLFRDCGIPVLLRRYPQYAVALAEANADERGEFTAAEERVCRTNHAAVGGLLAQAWWLPDHISLAIRRHHELSLPGYEGPGTPGDASLRLAAVAQLAEHLLQMHTGLSRTREWQKAGPRCMALLGLAEADLADIQAASGPLATAAA